MYKWLKSYFTISKREFNGMFVFIILMASIFLVPFVYDKIITEPLKIKIEIIQPSINKIEINTTRLKQPNYYNEKKETKSVLFYFNPNTLNLNGWVKLGLSEKQAGSILKYVAKGGKFYSKQDVKKMYAISQANYNKFEPYIQIPENINANSPANTYTGKPTNANKTIENVSIEINGADSVTLTTIKGIGPAFASRILKYRNRIGGFATIAQLKDVYGIDSIKYEQIKNQITVNTALLTKININVAEFDELKKMPYLTYKQINAIIAYRKQHGKFIQLSDVEKIVILTPSLIQKIAPYVQF
ncbi:MAG: hypothetical protein EAZ51_07190 [Sphingobacteriales bacterium]|nr:MAG: hypothetical protein EAZ64_06395 [Sphingobacteriales bacterium]TAF79821.1 MAG: hypothetical protein EAZ51_07190 [Sphingobacteriales bacterium]